MSFSEWIMKYREEHGCKPLMSECYEAGQQSKQEEIDTLKEALKYMLDQLDHPYRASGERIENKVNMILNKLTTKQEILNEF